MVGSVIVNQSAFSVGRACLRWARPTGPSLPIIRSCWGARHERPFLVSHWLFSLPRRLAAARSNRPKRVNGLMSPIVHSKKYGHHFAVPYNNPTVTVISKSLGTPFGRYFLATANCLGRLNSQWEARNGPSCRDRQPERTIGLVGFQATNQHFGGQCLPQTSTTHGPIRGPLANYNCRKIKTRKK